MLRICIFWFVCLYIGAYSLTGPDECRDFPLLGSACKNVRNLREWCDRSRLQGQKNQNNLAQICRASCGFCDTNQPANVKPVRQPFSNHAPIADTRKEPAKAAVSAVAFQSNRKISKPKKLFLPSSVRPATTTPAPCGVPPNYTACVPLQFSNLLFEQCCQQSGIQPACLHLCRYDVKVEEVQLAAFKQECPFSILPAYFTCASRNADNTKCCQDTGVLEDTGPQCGSFCNPKNGDWKSIGFQHVKCASYLEEIMLCHWAGLR